MTDKLRQNPGQPGGKPQAAPFGNMSWAVSNINVSYSKGILKVPGIHFQKIRVENTNACKYTCVMCPRKK